MAKIKYYGVLVGRKKGVFETWDECNEQVKGFKDAKFKSFFSRQEAEMYVAGLEVGESLDFYWDLEHERHVFTDGSFNKDTNTVGFAYVELRGKGKEELYQNSTNHDFYVKSANVAGEYLGVLEAMKHIGEQNPNLRKLHIHVDFESLYLLLGITLKEGQMKKRPQTQLSRMYVTKFKEYVDKFGYEVVFYDVMAHGHHKYNELADRLAKKACGRK